MYNIANVLHAFKLYTLKWLILYYVNFTSVITKLYSLYVYTADQIVSGI